MVSEQYNVMNERMLILQKESTSFWVLTKKEKVLFRELYIKFSCGAVALWLTDLRATMLGIPYMLRI